MTVSYVHNCHTKETSPISLDEVFNDIRTGERGLKEQITQIRNRFEAEFDITGSEEEARKAVAALKMRLPGFLPSGLFSERSNGKLVAYSGLLCGDMDSIGADLVKVKGQFRDSPFVHAVAVSPSGNGLKVFFNVVHDPARHEDSFRAIQDFVRNMTGLEIDEKCKDPARICFFTWDDDLWLREEGNEPIAPADPIPPPSRSSTGPSPNQTLRERIAFNLLGPLDYNTEKDGYFCRCPGEHLHTNKTADKHTIVYLVTVPTLKCQHGSCGVAVDTFNRLLRSEIGKAEAQERQAGAGKNGQEDEESEVTWDDALDSSFVTTGELKGLTLRTRAKLLDEWFREGDLGYIFGFRGVAKTWFSLGLGTALATGGRLGEWQAHEETQVAYIDSEMPAEDIRSRAVGLGLSENFHLLNHELLFERTGKVVNVNNITIQKAISQYCIRSGVRVLFIDNLSTAAYGMKENEADSWEQMSRWLLELRREKIAVVIVHHAGRAGNMRGTSKREDAAFWVIQLDDAKKDSEDKSGARFITRFTKASRNTYCDIPPYEWHFAKGIDGEISIGCKLSEGLEVFRAVLRSGVTKPSEIAKLMGIPDYQVSRLAKKAIDAGWLKRASRGEYRLTEDEPK